MSSWWLGDHRPLSSAIAAGVSLQTLEHLTRPRTIKASAQRSVAYAIVRECCRYAAAAPSTLKAKHIDLAWSSALAAEARELFGHDSAWNIEPIVDDSELTYPSPVLGVNVNTQDRDKVYKD